LNLSAIEQTYERIQEKQLHAKVEPKENLKLQQKKTDSANKDHRQYPQTTSERKHRNTDDEQVNTEIRKLVQFCRTQSHLINTYCCVL